MKSFYAALSCFSLALSVPQLVRADWTSDTINKFNQGMEDARRRYAEQEAARQQRWQEMQQMEAEQEQRRLQRQAEQAEYERQLAEQQRIAAEQEAARKAEEERLAAEKAARELAEKRARLDQFLGGITLAGGAPAPASAPAAAAATPPAPDRAPVISDDPVLADRLRQIGELVRASRYAEARKLAAACQILYPDDPRARTAIDQINALEGTPSASH